MPDLSVLFAFFFFALPALAIPPFFAPHRIAFTCIALAGLHFRECLQGPATLNKSTLPHCFLVVFHDLLDS